MRLNRYLAESGLFSRREADRQIEYGKVTVNGVVASLGTQVSAEDVVMFEGREVRPVAIKKTIVFNKPRGVEVTLNRQVKDNIADYLNLEERLFPVGRLDKDSEGLILLTNDGEMANEVLRAANAHEKEYIVTVDKPVTEGFLSQMRQGVPILEQVTAPCIAEALDKWRFRIILSQGLNRQIRRMCEALGYKVVRLIRVRVMHLTLEGLTSGQYRMLTSEELKILLEQTQAARTGRGLEILNQSKELQDEDD